MKKHLGLLALIASNVLSGFNTPLIHQAVHKMPPYLFGFLRVLLSFVIILPIALLVRHNKPKHKRKISRSDFSKAAFGALLIYGVSNLAFYVGMTKTTSINASIIILLWPIIFFLANIEVLKERFSRRTFIGIGLAFIGALIAVVAPMASTLGTAAMSPVGSLLILICVVVDVIGTLILKRVLKRMSALDVLAIGLGVATIFYAIVAFPYLGQISLVMDPAVRNAILYGSLMVGCIGYGLGFYGLHATKGGEYSVISYLQPITGITAAMLFFNERFTPSLAIGALAVFLGLYLVEARHLGHNHGTHR